MPVPSLPVELWVRILPLLQNDTPAVLSRPDRGGLHYQGLTIPSRVCKVTFSKALLAGVADPSTHALFAKTEKLQLEYSPRDRLPSYTCILSAGGDVWNAVGVSKVDARGSSLWQCAVEAGELLSSLKALNAVGLSGVFPKVKVITVGSTYGREHDGWRRFGERGGAATTLVAECRVEFAKLLRSGNLKHLCIRDPAGPLSLPRLSYASARPNSSKLGYTTCIHFDKHVDHLPVPLGDKITWVFDGDNKDDWADMVTNIGSAYEKFGDARKDDVVNRSGRDAVDVQIYCSTPKWGLEGFEATRGLFGRNMFSPEGYRLNRTPAQQRSMATELARMMQIMNRQETGCLDTYKWNISAETPVCPACGSGAPR